MPKQTSESTQERVRLAQKRADRPENLKEQGEAGNRTQNITPQHRQQDR